MNIGTFRSGFLHYPIVHFATLMLFALAWSSLAFCGEIHEAAKQGDLAKVEALLKDNPNLVSSKDNNVLVIDGSISQTPLHYAVSQGHKDVVAFLLANKADANVKNKYDATPLHLAASESHKDMVELLLANKADVNAKNNEGWTPLHEAVACEKNGCKDVVKLLRQHGGRE